MGDILHGDQVLHSQPVALAFHLGPVDDYPCVSSEAVNATQTLSSRAQAFRPFILQFGHWLLHTKNNNVFSSNTDSGPALLHGLLQVLHLEEVAIGRKTVTSAVIAHARGALRLGWGAHSRPRIGDSQRCCASSIPPAHPTLFCFYQDFISISSVSDF